MARQAAKAATQAAARASTSTTGRQALSAANGLEATIQAAEMAKDLVDKADEETGEQDITCPTGSCAEEENQKRREEQERKLKELEEESVETDTNNRTRNFEKKGTLEDAVKDFRSLNPDDIKSFEMDGGGIGYSGKLKDGSTVSIRPESSTGHPTLQHTPVGKWPKTKFRYIK